MKLQEGSALAAGDLDLTFGEDGVVQVNDPLRPEMLINFSVIAVDPAPDSGARFYAGHPISSENGGNEYVLCVVRLLENGQLDSSFGEGGYVIVPTTEPGRNRSMWFFYDFIFGAPGEITCLGGTVANRPYGGNVVPMAVRLSSSGEIDRSFGANGLAIYDNIPMVKTKQSNEGVIRPDPDELTPAVFPDRNEAGDGTISGSTLSARLADGKILFLANISGVGTYQHNSSYLVRINSDGSLDETYGTDGLVLITDPSVDPGIVDCWSCDIDPRGGAAVVGRSGRLGFVGRYDTSGLLDRGFGESGVVHLRSNPGDEVSPKIVKTLEGGIDNGKMIIQATVLPNNEGPRSQYPLITKLLPNGARDPDFNNGEPVIVDLRPLAYVVNSMMVDDGGRILIAGERMDFGTGVTAVCLSRFMPRGMPDAGFGSEGTRVYEGFIGLFIEAALQNRVNILTLYSPSISRFVG